MILSAIKSINLTLRPKIVSIIEAYDFSDTALCSAVGNSYGDIYETHLEWAKGSRLNQTDGAIPEGFMQYMMPIIRAKL